MRFDLEQLDHASDAFFAAALNPSQWPAVLEKVAIASDAWGINIVPIAGRAIDSIIATDSLKPAMERYFGDEWHQRDFRALQAPLLQRQGVLLEQDFASAEQFETLDYYKAQVEFGMRWTAMVGFSSGEDVLAFVLHRQVDDGPFERDEAAVLHHIRQKLMIAATMMRDISASTVKGMCAAFEIANVACIFFDRLGVVTTVNEKAKTLLGADLQITNGELRPASADDAAMFNRRLKSVLGSAVSFEPDENAVLLFGRQGKRPLVARIQRIGGEVQDVFTHSCAVAVIEDPEERVQQRPGTLNKLFGLTRAEAEIAQSLAQGMSLHEIASLRTISYETARAHLKAVYRKTETNRQSELSLLLAKIRMS
jgi:DNA-binding CsgD family transcriptional regulator